MHYSIEQAKNLFQSQAELIDTKVEMMVIKSISQVVDQIVSLRFEMHKEIGSLRDEMHSEIGGLRNEIHQVREEMNTRFSKIGERLSAVEATLGKRNQVRGEIRVRFIDYAFKAGWLMFGGLMMFVLVHSQSLLGINL